MLSNLFIVFVLSLLPLSAHAGMYGQPVVNLDAKTFKTVMANEHAAVSLCVSDSWSHADIRRWSPSSPLGVVIARI